MEFIYGTAALIRDNPRTSRCACCKKWVEHSLPWGYWYGDDFCCSYHCMRELRRAERELMGEDNYQIADRAWMPVNAAERAEILRLKNNGVSKNEIHLRTHRSIQTINRILSEAGKPPRTRATISQDIKAQIRELKRTTTLTYRQIGSRFGLSEGTAYRIVNYERIRD